MLDQAGQGRTQDTQIDLTERQHTTNGIPGLNQKTSWATVTEAIQN